MGQGTAQLRKLAITACTVQTNGDIRVGSNTFRVMLNPSSWSHRHTISYDRKAAFGKASPTVRFAGTDEEEVSFDLVLDGTGVVEGATQDVRTQVERLKGIVYDYDGHQHEPSVVKLAWGSLVFFGRLRGLSVEYTVFEPGGDPLRAKVKLAFLGFMSEKEESLRANRSSPDLSHVIVVQKGDTLPLLCHRVYKDAAYYPAVARFNDLTDFRHLEPGTRIRLPPLRPRDEMGPTSGAGVRKYPRSPSRPAGGEG
jgi:hypothetical protein